jgi:hypothetical protein
VHTGHCSVLDLPIVEPIDPSIHFSTSTQAMADIPDLDSNTM